MWFYYKYAQCIDDEASSCENLEGWILFNTETPYCYILSRQKKDNKLVLRWLSMDSGKVATLVSSEEGEDNAAEILFRDLITRLQATTPPEKEYPKYPFAGRFTR